MTGTGADVPQGFHARLSEIVDEMESRVAAEIAQESLEVAESELTPHDR